ncbi:hypothetical protein H0H10_13750 [Streptomyces sp. TRM S81-3]|uniref:Uncharacterized protein n=1 Tax=Streptomyces griseicoloratus TaxID=2752516 RepID=A0A926L1L8_9ACTN|nr:hypothetical protein [Streptomyces griseicoloratus]MBD0420215.1 hypothetical protein [Streptomyces griseicoloratus]
MTPHAAISAFDYFRAVQADNTGAAREFTGAEPRMTRMPPYRLVPCCCTRARCRCCCLVVLLLVAATPPYRRLASTSLRSGRRGAARCFQLAALGPGRVAVRVCRASSRAAPSLWAGASGAALLCRVLAPAGRGGR